jgi:hypothetical protein
VFKQLIKWFEMARRSGAALEAKPNLKAQVKGVEQSQLKDWARLKKWPVRLKSCVASHGGHLHCDGHAYQIWRPAVRKHFLKMQVLQSKCFRITTNASRCVSNRQIHDDFEIVYSARHIRALTNSLD